MQSNFQQEHHETERRYRPETVKKAAALAARLQEEQRDTLTQAEVDQLAAEIGLDPRLMRQALEAVAKAEAQQVRPARRQTPTAPLAFTCIASGFFLFLFPIFLLRTPPEPPATAVMVPPPVEAGTLDPGTGIQNGGFEAGSGSAKAGEALPPGSRALPGWTVDHGEVFRVATAGGHALRLGANGRIRQLFKTIPGQRYRLSFALSGEPGDVNRLHRVKVEVGSTSAVPSAFTPAGSGRPLVWEHPVVGFEAQEAGTLLILSAGPTDAAGIGSPLIDDIRIEPLEMRN